jgi:hypothetical protein
LGQNVAVDVLSLGCIVKAPYSSFVVIQPVVLTALLFTNNHFVEAEILGFGGEPVFSQAKFMFDR